jgi:hypothetical protein
MAAARRRSIIEGLIPKVEAAKNATGNPARSTTQEALRCPRAAAPT